MNNPDQPSLMTAAEVGTLLRLDKSTVCRLARDGEIPATKIGGSWRFNREEIAKITQAPE